LLHRSDGSEANDVIDAFASLPRGDKDAIIKFLHTLRLPLDPRYDLDVYRQVPKHVIALEHLPA
jgi:hypothetical protein